MMLLVLLLAGATAGRLPTGNPAAREKARQCQEQSGEESMAACRAALALGLGPERASAIDQILASRLASLDRWDELVELYRGMARLRPADASAQYHLGAALLLADGRAEESLAPLREAARLQPEGPSPWILLGVALNALARYDEAVAAFEEALRLDPAALDGLPAARATLEASQRQERWP